MRGLAAVALALLLIACGGRETTDDQGLHQDVQNSTNGAEVTFDATVLNDPVQSGGVVIHGQLYIDPGPHYGVHCTHAHTSSGCPSPGWIEYNNNYYE